MRPARNPRLLGQLFCYVDSKTLEVIDGPRTLPHNWGNVSGFNNLRPPDLKKYWWFPLADFSLVPPDSTAYSLVFLPEKEVVVKVHEVTTRGLLDQVLAHLQVNYQNSVARREILSSITGKKYWFPNTTVDAVLRLTCFQLGKDYECVAKTEAGAYEHVIIPAAELGGLLEDLLAQNQKQLDTYKSNLTRVTHESADGLRALLDTDLAELYDD